VSESDETSFEAFYRDELAVIAALGAVLTGSRDAGLDVAHEAMLRAFREWRSKVSRLDRPGAWVRRVAINLAIDTNRRDGRQRAGLERLALEREPAVDSFVDDGFWVAVRELPPRQRAVIALHYVDDMPVRDIAATRDTTDGAVKSALSVARRRLATVLAVEEVVP